MVDPLREQLQKNVAAVITQDRVIDDSFKKAN